MKNVCALFGVVAMVTGCAARAPAWKGTVEWPDEQSAKLVGQPMEAGAVLAAAGAIRELIRTNPYPRLFDGCSSPEQGLVAVVFTGPTEGLYYVRVIHDFVRCQGPRFRLLDGWDVYAVTPQGQVVAKDPLGPGEAPQPAPDVQPPSTPPAPEPGPGGDAERSSGTVTE
ncbi:hypothetical protein D7X55_31325 [Corallococcus sp. AB049A]|uniref:Lipoprotein n=1 Tax=Corallococcus interemptor TaxID=2316720 RepID=A0A3A8QJW3_9BACT|nr:MULTISPECIES: hypothetical protein [Corallococcus]RKH68847.1 hypothetical protein D7X96_16665 [Corallococcus interemptor]RKI53342.1 hypothetical protein D7X55_31325 [Corallococcus sp. AB049A]